MGVIVACVPAFSPLLKSFSKKISYNSRSRSGTYGPKTGNKSRVTAQGQKSAVENGSRLSRSRILASFRDDDELELCETKSGWIGESQGWNTAEAGHSGPPGQTDKAASDGDSDRASGSSSQLDKHKQQITVVSEYTVRHSEAR